jgi:electron transport complex protein RnfD
MIIGAYGGGIGETCSLAIICAGLYLIYRNYVTGYLSGMMILAAALTAAIAPIRTGACDFQMFPLLGRAAEDPLLADSLAVGFLYVVYQVLAGELLLSAFFLAPEMTSRPVTAPAQAIFGLLAGSLGMMLALYTSIPIPFYAAVLICNTFTPVLDGIRPRVLGQRRWWRRAGH